MGLETLKKLKEVNNKNEVLATTAKEIDTVNMATLLEPEEVARRTRELLNSQGWCLWSCSAFGDDIIARVLDEDVEGVPEGYPVYTEAELEELCRDGVDGATLRLVHEAKRIAGAVVISVKNVERENYAS